MATANPHFAEDAGQVGKEIPTFKLFALRGVYYRRRQWKFELAKFATDEGLKIQVCHLPPGTSQWNKIKHRPFSVISVNWRGSSLDEPRGRGQPYWIHHYEDGVKSKQRTRPTGISPENTDIRRTDGCDPASLERNSFRGELNYTILVRARG